MADLSFLNMNLQRKVWRSPNDVTDDKVQLVYGGDVFKGGSEITYDVKYRTWQQVSHSGPETSSRDSIEWTTALESSLESPRRKYSGNEYQCLFSGELITRDICHYTCLRLQNPKIRKGLCMHNVCFCDWKLPDKSYKHTYLSLRASKNIKGVTSIKIRDLIQASLVDGSTSGSLQEQLPVHPQEGLNAFSEEEFRAPREGHTESSQSSHTAPEAGPVSSSNQVLSL